MIVPETIVCDHGKVLVPNSALPLFGNQPATGPEGDATGQGPEQGDLGFGDHEKYSALVESCGYVVRPGA
ncbi:hypothetical protein [Kitasatospora purpeofusca]|uniref:hypothetical protein n=1 Tax=Kitasatospora purpeofusca TaxID=67352 RepID=UPI00365DEE54